MTSLWWAIISGKGYSEPPTDFTRAVCRGNLITGAAWRQGVEDAFIFAMERKYPAEYDDKRSKQEFQKKTYSGGPIGKSLSNCPKLHFEQVVPSSGDFWSYFTHQGFTVIRPTPTNGAIVPVAPTVGDAQSSDDAYIVLGLSPDASLDDVKRAGRDLMKLFHPDKGAWRHREIHTSA